MTRHTIPLGRILGIPIGLDYSWFLIFGLITWTLAVGYYPNEFTGRPPQEYWIVGAITACMLFVSVLLHELGHSAVALHYRIPVRSITLLIFGGVAQIATEPPSAAAEFWIAIAGPVVSFALATLFRLLQSPVAGVAPLLALAKYLAYINGVLALFNLIPGFPLDGGRVFRAVVWGVTHSLRRATLMAANVGRFFGFLFIFSGVWQILGGNAVNGLWIAFIGWFLETAAVAQIQQQMVQGVLAGHTVADAMSRNYTTVRADEALQQLVDEHILGGGRRSFAVTRGEEIAGLLTLQRIKQVPRPEWSTTTAARVMIPVSEMKRVRPDTALWAALEEMDRDGVNQLPVMQDGTLVGMLTREDLISFLRTLQEYER